MDTTTTIKTVKVEPIAAFTDNYIWLITNPGDSRAWVVDPGDAQAVLNNLDKKQLQLEGILLTHHHPDHDGGIPHLLQHYPDARVVSGMHSRSPYNREQYPDNATIVLFNRSFKLMDVPGHTLDHVAFYCAEESILFPGDTLFGCGCGRLFEGTAEQMYRSLSRLAALPGDTLHYCAHEYTEGNIRFAVTVEPDNLDLQQRAADTKTLRAQGLATLPSYLSRELATNPFLRCLEPSIMAAASEHSGTRLASALDVFTTLRAWKDQF
jgi:hydroxyacylglutathione hydrolase